MRCILLSILLNEVVFGLESHGQGGKKASVISKSSDVLYLAIVT